MQEGVETTSTTSDRGPRHARFWRRCARLVAAGAARPGDDARRLLLAALPRMAAGDARSLAREAADPAAVPLLRSALDYALAAPGARRFPVFEQAFAAAFTVQATDLVATPADPATAGKLGRFVDRALAGLAADTRLNLLAQLPPDLAAARPDPPAGRIDPAALSPLQPLLGFRRGPAPASDGEGWSVAVVARGRAFQLRRLLASLAAFRPGPDVEVLVFLNGAGEAEERALSSWPGPAPRVLRSGAPVPVGVARNALVREARHRRVVSLDSDMVLLRPVAELCRARRRALAGGDGPFWNIGYLGARELAVAKLAKYVQPAPAGADGAALLPLANRTAVRMGAAAFAASMEAGHPAVVPGNRLSGGASVLPRRAFLDLGGFEPAFDIGWEDVEFSLRLAGSGRPVLNELSFGLFHGHLMADNEADLAVETDRFEPARYAAGRAVFAAAGFRPDWAAGRDANPFSDEAFRRARLKAALLRPLATLLADELTAEPVVCWVASARELAAGAPLAEALSGCPRRWRNAVLFAPEVGAATRLAAAAHGSACVVLSAAALDFLAARADGFASAFAALNRASRAPVLVWGEAPAPAGLDRLRALLPAAPVVHVPRWPDPAGLAAEVGRAVGEAGRGA